MFMKGIFVLWSKNPKTVLLSETPLLTIQEEHFLRAQFRKFFFFKNLNAALGRSGVLFLYALENI